MEVKINKEIRSFKEQIYFGLSLRQFICSFLACATSVLLYFYFNNLVGSETGSWICMLGAFPFAFLGFFNYNGMPAERFILAWVRSNILISKRLVFKPYNFYNELLVRKEIDDEIIQKNKRCKS